jgi:glutathione S-transferase
MPARGESLASVVTSKEHPMKLYVLPGSCALACHIALEWADAAYELEVLTRDSLQSEQFLAVNPKAKVPALMLDANDVITEAPAVLLLIADLFPDAPPASDLVRRAKLNETLSELTSEAHPAFGCVRQGLDALGGYSLRRP